MLKKPKKTKTSQIQSKIKCLKPEQTWSGLSPVKQNMPIWSMMCCQLRLDPSLARPATSFSLIVMILSAIPFTSPNLKINQKFSSINCYYCISYQVVLAQFLLLSISLLFLWVPVILSWQVESLYASDHKHLKSEHKI